MNKLIVSLAIVAACGAPAWAGYPGSRCTTDSQCTVGGYKLVCNSYWHTCEQPGYVGTQCRRDADCRYPLYCSAANGYTCRQRQRQ